jgi:hypothetical protein
MAIDPTIYDNPAIALDPAGKVHITYFGSGWKLKYATNK